MNRNVHFPYFVQIQTGDFILQWTERSSPIPSPHSESARHPPPQSIFIPVCWRLSLCLCANGLDNLQIALLKPFFLFSLQFLCSRLLVWLGRAHVALFLDSAVCIISPRHLCPAVKLHCMCAPIHFAKESLQRGEERDGAGTNAAFVLVFSKLSFPKSLNISFFRHSGLNICQWIFLIWDLKWIWRRFAGAVQEYTVDGHTRKKRQLHESRL